MENKITIKQISGLAIICAIEAVLAYISGFISFGPVNINLALIPIVIASILYGKVGGGIVGAVNGFIILLSPSSATLLGVNFFGTIVLAVVKTFFAGYISGKAYNNFIDKKKAVIFCSILVPFINTFVYIVGAFIIYEDFYRELATQNSMSIVYYVFGSVVTINFAIELVTSLILSNVTYRIIKLEKRR